jgi:hypothetical protein
MSQLNSCYSNYAVLSKDHPKELLEVRWASIPESTEHCNRTIKWDVAQSDMSPVYTVSRKPMRCSAVNCWLEPSYLHH